MTGRRTINAVSRIVAFMSVASAPLSDHVYEVRFSALYHFDATPDRIAQTPGIGNRSFRPHPHALRKPRIVDEGIIDFGPDMDPVDTAAAAVGRALDSHHLLVVRAIVMHERQNRDAVMGGGPQDAGRVHHVPIRLDID